MMSRTRTSMAEPEAETGTLHPLLPSLEPGGEEKDLIARAYLASDVCQGVVEILPTGLRWLSASPACSAKLGLSPSAFTGATIEEICKTAPSRHRGMIDRDFFAMLSAGALDAWRGECPSRFDFVDTRAQPPRRLAVTVRPLPAGPENDPRKLCCFRLEELSEKLWQAPEENGQENRYRDSHFRHLLDTAPALIWISDVKGDRDYFNETWLAFTGRRIEEELGQGWISNLHTEDVDRYLETVADAFHSHESFRIEYRLRRRDGLYRWMLDLGMPRFRSDGEFLGYVGSSTDITDRHHAEKHLERSERWYRDLIERTDNLVVQIDPDGYLMFVNPVCRNILGAEPEECVGFPFLDFVCSDDRDRTGHQMARWWKGGSTKVTFENRLTSRTGENHDLLWTFDVHVDEQGHPVSLSGIAQDITERKRSERLHKIQSQVLESMIEGVTLTNEDGFVLFTNTALDEMFGYEPGELVGQPLDILEGSPLDASAEVVAERVREDGCYRGRFVHRSKNGLEIHTRVHINMLEIDGARHRVSVISDVTAQQKSEAERKRLNQRIRQAQKLESLGVLAGGIAHDFNNLLMVILGNASLALQDLDPMASAYNDIEQIESAAMRAADLTKQMLAYSGKGQFLVEPSQISVVVEEMAHLLESSISKGIELKLELEPDLPAVECDVSQVRQVVLNLVTNASESIEKGSGSIEVSTGSRHCTREELEQIFIADELPEGLYSYIRVSDSGAGMDAETQSKIFDPFFTTKFTGRGLGLAAVLGIVRGHRGGIRIESEPGTGSKFEILLPCIRAEEPEPEPEPTKDEAIDTDGTILVVDDDDTVRDMAGRMLERLGFRVLMADGGESALEIFHQHRDEIDVVILDMTMPRMDGPETYENLCKIQPDVAVILSSGYTEQIAAERFGDEGLAGFLQKPYRQTDLILELDRVLDLRS